MPCALWCALTSSCCGRGPLPPRQGVRPGIIVCLSLCRNVPKDTQVCQLWASGAEGQGAATDPISITPPVTRESKLEWLKWYLFDIYVKVLHKAAVLQGSCCALTAGASRVGVCP